MHEKRSFHVNIKSRKLTSWAPFISPLLIRPVTSSKLASALSSRLSTTSTTPLHCSASASPSVNRGPTKPATPELCATLPRSLPARPRSRAFCWSSCRAKEGSRERWKERSSPTREVVVRVVLRSEDFRFVWRELKESMSGGGGSIV
jgi:hypothetical protein